MARGCAGRRCPERAGCRQTPGRIARQHDPDAAPRRGRAAAERAVGKVGIEGVVAPQRLHDLGVKPVAAHRAVRLAGVVENAPRGVRDENAGNAGILHQRHRGGDVLLAQLLQTAQRRHHHAHAALQRRLLGAHDQIFRHDQRVGVHENEHCRNDQNITQAEFDL